LVLVSEDQARELAHEAMTSTLLRNGKFGLQKVLLCYIEKSWHCFQPTILYWLETPRKAKTFKKKLRKEFANICALHSTRPGN